MRSRRLGIGLAASAGLGLACATGGGLKYDHCEVRVERLVSWEKAGARVAYEVSGRAGSPAKVWLAGRNPSGTYVSGRAILVEPGPYRAVVELALDRRPEKYVAVLQVAGKRCTDDAPMP